MKGLYKYPLYLLFFVVIGFTISCSQQVTSIDQAIKSSAKDFISNTNSNLAAKERVIGVLEDNEFANQKDFEIRNMTEINSEFDDFSTCFISIEKYNQFGIAFASARNNSPEIEEYQSKNNNKPFTDIFYSSIVDNFNFSPPVRLNEGFPSVFRDLELNTNFHDAVFTFSDSGNKMYLTQNNKRESTKDTLNLQIISFSKSEGEWKKDTVNRFAYNHPDHSCAHPTISADGKRLIFSSDMPYGYGGMDLYVRKKLSDGSWGVAENLGPSINTDGNEIFPYIHNTNTLYYASDGIIGLGGLDIYKSEYDKTKKWYNVENLGGPINSSSDDFGLIFFAEGDSGFFSSNRPGGKGNDDIYFFKKIKPDIELFLEGDVKLLFESTPIEKATVQLIALPDSAVETDVTLEDGTFNFPLDLNTDYIIKANKIEYTLVNLKKVSTKLKTKSDTIVVHLKMRLDDCNKVYQIPNVEYDFDKWVLRESSKKILDNVYADMLELLKTDPEAILEINSHTDSRGTNQYNDRLSRKRAQSCVEYLIYKDEISRNNLLANWHGESKPIEDCIKNYPGICVNRKYPDCPCHQKNRRTDLRLICKEKNKLSKN